MHKLRTVIVAGVILVLGIATPAGAASPGASCPGQELSAIAPVFRADLGGFISFEARSSRDGGTSAPRSTRSRTRTAAIVRKSRVPRTGRE